jgi:hypothetical protein
MAVWCPSRRKNQYSLLYCYVYPSKASTLLQHKENHQLHLGEPIINIIMRKSSQMIMGIVKISALVSCVMLTMIAFPPICNSSDAKSIFDGMLTSEAASEPRNFKLANEQSFGFFDDIDESNWKNLQRIAGEMVDHESPEDPLKYLPLDNSTNKPWDKYFDWYQTVSSRVLRYCYMLFLIVMFTGRFYIHFRWQANLTNDDHDHFAYRTTNLTSAVPTR